MSFTESEVERLRSILDNSQNNSLNDSLNASQFEQGELVKLRAILNKPAEVDGEISSFSAMSASIVDKMTTFKPCVEKDAPDKISKKSYTEYKQYFNHRIRDLTNKDPLNLHSILKHSAGKQFIKLLDTLDVTESASRADNPVNRIFEILDKHFDDDSESVNARIVFHNMNQEKGEKHVEFLNRVILESKKCNFGNDEVEREIRSVIRVRSSNVHIRHQSGALDASIEKIRHAAGTVDMDEVIWKQDKDKTRSSSVNHVMKHKRRRYVSSQSSDEESQALQVREKQSRPSYRSESTNHSERFQRNQSGQSSRQCYRCGGSNHESRNCRFKDVTCNNCGKMGHLRRVCSSSARPSQLRPPPGRFSSFGRSNDRRESKKGFDDSKTFKKSVSEASSNVLKVSEVKAEDNVARKSNSSSPEYTN